MNNETMNNDTEEYDWLDYDIEESYNYFPWDELIPPLVIYSITFCLGLIGNLVIIGSTICHLGHRPLPDTPTNIFLGGLASADLILITFCIPVKIAKLFSYSWTMGAFLCKSVHYIQSISTICSVLTLTAMSVERYYAIVHPMRAQYTCTSSQATRIVIIIWIASIFLAIPILFTQTHADVGVRIPAHLCIRDSNHLYLWRSHELYMLFLVLVVPLVVMGYCYTTICCEIYRVMKRRYHMTSGNALNFNGECIPMANRGQNSDHRWQRSQSRRDDEESRIIKQVVKMLVAVVVLFAICWSPMLIDNVLTAFAILPKMKQSTFKHMNTTFQLMAYFNSCINPIVYGFMSKNFRESFLAAACGSWCCCCCCCRKRVYTPPVKRYPSLSQTRTTVT